MGKAALRDRRQRIIGGRPASLSGVVARHLETGTGLDPLLREFCDAFYELPDAERPGMINEEPALLPDKPQANAYLAAVAEHLARRYRLPVPPWTGQPDRFLKRPFFPCGLESLKATLLVESPASFRRRMIFVGADPLYRPRRDTADNEGQGND